MEHLSSFEAQQAVSLCLRPLAISLIGYISLITGIEVGGRMAGYPGKGMEIHEKLVKTILNSITRNGKGKK